MAVIKINTIALTDMHVEEIFNFWTDFKDKVRGLGAETVHLLPVWDVYMAIMADLDAALEEIRKSDLTRELVQLDKERDRLFYSLRKIVKGYFDYYETAKVDAARRIMIVLKVYNDTPKLNRDEETAKYYNLVQELRTNLATDLTTLTLTPLVTEMDKANKAYKNKSEARDTETTSKELPFTFKQKRNEMYPVYEECCGRIVAGAYFDTTEECREFVKGWNTTIERYKNRLRSRGENPDTKEEENNGNTDVANGNSATIIDIENN